MTAEPWVVLLVDDHPLARDGLEAALQQASPAMSAVHASTLEDGLANLSADIDVVVAEVRLPDGSGLRIAEAILERSLTTRCVLLTAEPDPAALIAAHDTGAVDAFCTKSGAVADIVAAVLAANRGLASLGMRDVAEAKRLLGDIGLLDRSALSEREQAIVDCVGEGLADREIAELLSVAPQTVRNALTSIYKTVGASSRGRLQAMVLAERYGSSPGNP